MRKLVAVCSVVGLMSFVGALGVSANEASPCGGTPGIHDGAVGQDPGATGYDNSTASQACN